MTHAGRLVKGNGSGGYPRARGSHGWAASWPGPGPPSISRRAASPRQHRCRGCWLYNQPIGAYPGDDLARLHLAICSPPPTGLEALRAAAWRAETPPNLAACKRPKAYVSAVSNRYAGVPRASSPRRLREVPGLSPNSRARPQLESNAVRPKVNWIGRLRTSVLPTDRPQLHPRVRAETSGGRPSGAAVRRSRFHARARYAPRPLPHEWVGVCHEK